MIARIILCGVKFVFIRTKDSAWVYSSLSHSVPEALEFAVQYGHDIKLMIHKVKFDRKIFKHCYYIY